MANTSTCERRKLVFGAGTVLVTALTGCSQGDSGSDPTTEENSGNTPTTEEQSGATPNTEEQSGTTPTTEEQSGATPTTEENSLVASVEQQGYYAVNNAGTRADPPFEHLYRSDTDPLRMETDVGGVVAARPHDRGVELSADLTAEDQFAGSSVYFGRWSLQDISEIDFAMEGDEMRLLIQMDLSGDGDFLDWEAVEGDKERFRGFAGDDRAVSTYQTDGPVAADDAIFNIPPGGSQSPTEGTAIADLRDFGDVPVWIGAGVDQRGLALPDVRRAVITEFSVASG